MFIDKVVEGFFFVLFILNVKPIVDSNISNTKYTQIRIKYRNSINMGNYNRRAFKEKKTKTRIIDMQHPQQCKLLLLNTIKKH